MNHLEFAAAEAAALLPTPWEQWVDRVEVVLGHSLDGDQAVDGYSMDDAHDAWESGAEVGDYVNTVRWNHRYDPR